MARSHSARGGGVYILQATDGRLFKIGASHSPRRRLRQIRASDRPATLLHVIPTSDPFGLEAALHKRYAMYRHDREWFALPPAAVVELCATDGVPAARVSHSSHDATAARQALGSAVQAMIEAVLR